MANIRSHAKLVKEVAMPRAVDETGRRMTIKTREAEASEIVDWAGQQLYEVAADGTHAAFVPMYPLFNPLFDKSLGMVTSSGVVGVSTGLLKVDEITAGLRRQDLIILGARPSMAKTSWAIDVAALTERADERRRSPSATYGALSRALFADRLRAEGLFAPEEDTDAPGPRSGAAAHSVPYAPLHQVRPREADAAHPADL